MMKGNAKTKATITSIIIPLGLDLFVQKHDKIQIGQILGGLGSLDHLQIDIASYLGVEPREIIKYLKIAIGDAVCKFDLLARKYNLLEKNEFFAPRGGKIEDISSENGTITIATGSARSECFLSPITGVIQEIKDNKIFVEVSDVLSVFEIHESTQDFGGVLVNESFDNDTTLPKVYLSDKSEPMTKLSVIGISALISTKSLATLIPFVLVEPKTYLALSSKLGSLIYVCSQTSEGIVYTSMFS